MSEIESDLITKLHDTKARRMAVLAELSRHQKGSRLTMNKSKEASLKASKINTTEKGSQDSEGKLLTFQLQ